MIVSIIDRVANYLLFTPSHLLFVFYNYTFNNLKCQLQRGFSCLFRISQIDLNSSIVKALPGSLLTTHFVTGMPGIPGAKSFEFTFTYTHSHPQMPFFPQDSKPSFLR